MPDGDMKKEDRNTGSGSRSSLLRRSLQRLRPSWPELADYLTAVLAGLAGSFAFAPAEQSYLIFITLWVLFRLLYLPRKQARKCWVLLGSLCFFTTFWIHLSMTEYSDVPMILAVVVMILFALYLSSYHALAIFLCNRLFRGQLFIKNILAVPACFILADYAAGHILTGFPWVCLGYTQIGTVFGNLAPVTGVHGITLALLLVTGLTYHGLRVRHLWHVAAALLLVSVTTVCGGTYTQPEKPVRAVLVQGNIMQQIKWDPARAGEIFSTYYQLSRPYFLGEEKTDLLIWPESALPDMENNIGDLIAKLDLMAQRQDFSFITGLQTYQPQDQAYYNSVLSVGVQDSPEDIYTFLSGNRYYKRHLVPFGEKVPFQEILRRYGSFFNMPMSSFSNGPDEQENIAAKGVRIASAICYEVAFPDEMQENIHDTTTLLLTLSNDGWFGTYNPATAEYHVSAGPYQHAAIARMRAMEFQKPMIRATNNGLTAVYDADGTVLAELPFYQQGVLTVSVTPRHGSTPFGIHGYSIVFSVIFGMLLIAGSHLLILMMTTTGRRRRIRERRLKRGRREHRDHLEAC